MSTGVCEMEAPEVFELDADGVLQVRQPGDPAAAEAAVRACPTGALQLVDGLDLAQHLEPDPGRRRDLRGTAVPAAERSSAPSRRPRSRSAGVSGGRTMAVILIPG